MVIDLVIDLRQSIVGAEHALQAHSGGDRRCIVRRKQAARADGRSRGCGLRATSQVHTERAHRQPKRLRAQDRVRNTRRAIAGYSWRAIPRRRGGQRLIDRKIALKQIPQRIPLIFKSQEVEELVFLDRSPYRGSKLFQLHRVLVTKSGWRRAENRAISVTRRRIEVVAGVKSIAASERVRRSVQGVRARLQSDVDDGSRLPAVLRGRILDDVEFLN